ncbi:hypothetical protein HWV62_28660 [Athelia sp. TMB]|nr:hypothetical protein HWV62_28660 [Athelia sp. TMB]
MAPKSAAGKEKLIEEDDLLQAVILADSFNKRFTPLTTTRPRCLLPICNAPLLDWTLESLALAGVHEVFVVCRSHANLVKAAIKESKWARPGSGLKIVPLVTAKETFSPGDAMRDVYTHGVITGDFVLVAGDLVSSVRISDAVRAHRERRRTDKDAIMTMVVRESGARHRTRSRAEASVFVLDAETHECLHYEPTVGYPPTTHARIPREALAAHPDLELRNDLIDCGIDICSVDVPSLFQDNFDYQDVRRDFVHGVLTSDLLTSRIHVHVARTGYAARVADPRAYAAVSADLLARWAFPLVPDLDAEHRRGNTYVGAGASLARSCALGPNALVGAGSTLGAGAAVAGSVLGRGVVVGAGAVLRGAYVWDGAVIGAGCVVERSIVGAGAVLGDGVRVERGCLIGDGVRIGAGAVVGPFARLSKRREVKVDGAEGDDEGEEEEEEEESEADEEEDDDDDDADSEDEEEDAAPKPKAAKPAKAPAKPRDDPVSDETDSELEAVEAHQDPAALAALGDTNAVIWPPPPLAADDDSDGDPREGAANQRLLRLGDDASDLDLSDAGSLSGSGSSSGSSSADEAEPDFSALASSLAAPSSDAGGAPAGDAAFAHEVALSLERAFAEGHSVDNAAVELKTLRMAANVPLGRVRAAVVGAIVDRIALVPDNAGAQRAEIARVVGRWGALIDRIGGVDAVETVCVLQAHCAAGGGGARLGLFGQVLAALYQDDVVEEADIRAWHALPASRGAGLEDGPELENVRKCWAVGARMIAQFDEQSSDDESE